LAGAGQGVGLLALADVVHPEFLRSEFRRRRSFTYRLRKLLSHRGPAIIAFRVRRIFGRERPKPLVYVPGTDEPIDWAAAQARERNYFPGPASAPVVIFSTNGYAKATGSRDLGWAALLDAGWEAELVPGNHDTMIGEPHVHVLAAKLAEHLRRVTRG
jgi:hypothetical protein